MKPTLNKIDFVIILGLGMFALAMHQKFVAPMLSPKVTK